MTGWRVLVGVAVVLVGLARGASALGGEAAVVGLFIPTGEGRPEAAEAAERGARTAVEGVNASGLLDGRRLELELAAADVAWAGAVGELRRLVDDPRVVAVVGGLDGRSTHLAAQVVTRLKGRLPLVTPWSSDSTITGLGVPWLFRLVPDDRHQAAALTAELRARKRHRPALLVLSDDPDFALLADAMSAELPGIQHLEADLLSDRRRLEAALIAGRVDALVVAGASDHAPPWLGDLPGEVFGPLALASSPGVRAPRPLDRCPEIEQEPLCRDLAAAYAHDAVWAVARALAALAADEPLHDAIRRQHFTGATGPVAFDDRGNRLGALAVTP